MASLWESLLGIGGDLAGSYFNDSYAGQAAEDVAAANREALQLSQENIQAGRGDIQDYGVPGLEDIISGYQGAINMIQDPGLAEQKALDFTGVNGPEAQTVAYNEFNESAGQQYLREQQEESLLRNAASIGGLGGGRVRSALQEQAYGRAATNDQRYLDNINRLIQPETNRSNNLGNILSQGGENLARYRAGLGSNLANISAGGSAQQIPLLTGIGEANAAASTARGNAIASGIGSITGTLGDLYG